MLVTTLERSLPVFAKLGEHESVAALGGALTGPFARMSSLPPTEVSARDGALEAARSALGHEAYETVVATRAPIVIYEGLVDYALDALDRSIAVLNAIDRADPHASGTL